MNLLLGLTVALLSQAIPNLDDAPQWQLEFEHRFGSIDDPETSLTRILSAAIGDNEEILLVQLNDKRIRMFDRDGNRIASYGNPGNGPMDLGHPIAVGLRGDTVWVSDNAAASLKFFSLDGKWLQSVTIAEIVGQGILAKAGYPLDNGDILANPRIDMRSRVDRVRVIPWIRYKRDGQVIDTLVSDRRTHQIAEIRMGEGRGFFTQPFDASDRVAVVPDGSGLVHVSQADTASTHPVRIERVDAGGRTVFSREYSASQRELTRALVRWTIDARAKLVEKVLASSLAFDLDEHMSGYADAIRTPEIIPPITEVLVADNGMIWVGRESVGDDTQRWVAIDGRTGNVAGQIRFPNGSRLIAASAEYVWMEELDELDVVHVARYRVIRE